MNNVSLLVIIITYNGMKWLDRCLSSVKNSSIKAQLFIVDNGSTDGSIEFIKKNYPEANLHVCTENRGFGRANNLGIQYALENDFDYVYLLNQDAWVEPNVFEALINAHIENSDYGILSPLQVNREKTRLDKNFVSCCNNEMLSDAICGGKLAPVYETSFVMAAHWLISRECLEMVGGFSPSFYHYGEDNNYAHRTLYFHKKIGIVPSCKGIHDREFRQITRHNKRKFFYIDNIVLLSNPNIKKRYARLAYKYLYALIKNNSIINIKYLIDTIISMKKLSNNLAISKSRGAFIEIKQVPVK